MASMRIGPGSDMGGVSDALMDALPGWKMGVGDYYRGSDEWRREFDAWVEEHLEVPIHEARLWFTETADGVARFFRYPKHIRRCSQPCDCPVNDDNEDGWHVSNEMIELPLRREAPGWRRDGRDA